MENNKDENSCRYLTSLKFILLKNNFDFRFPKKISHHPKGKNMATKQQRK